MPTKFINLHSDHNTLQVKYASHQKAESLRGTSFSKLDNKFNNNSIFNTKYAEFSTNLQVVLHFHIPTCAYNHPYNLRQKYFPLLHSISNFIIYPYFFAKPSLQSPITLSPSILQHFFTSLFLCRNTPTIYIKKSFPVSIIQPIQAASMEQRARESCEV